MKKNSRKNKKLGFMLIEVLVAISIITASTLAAMAVAQKSIVLSYRSVNTAQASFLLEEGAEAIRILRDDSWANISSLNTGTDYYLEFTGATWVLTTSSAQIDEFTRKINIADVYRDAVSGNISESGNLDAGTKLVTITVSWNEGTNTVSKTLSLYITDIFSWS
ncbi:MAG TPA: hypothetical protein PLO44_01255 [Candidatus Paceibacterota bacterium]|nr:hypothetical protein [Candidatus Paceibacterota bacterium]